MLRIKINKFLFLLTFALLPSVVVCGKKAEKPDTITARRAFIEMPSGVLDLLPKDTRLDMLDYYSNDSIWKATNNLRGISYLEKVAPDYLSVKLTPVSSMQFKVLKLKDGKEILMTVYTTGGEGENEDSDIEFYDARLNRLDKEKFFPTPKISYFFDTKGYQTKMKEIEEILPFYTIAFEAFPGLTDVEGRLTYKDAVSIEDGKIIEMFIRPSVKFIWDGKKFKTTE